VHYVRAGAKGGPKKPLALLELELQEAGSHHVGGGGTKPGSSAGAASALNHGAISPAPELMM
jgi:hypothetical protein